jgi:hypothetical protein
MGYTHATADDLAARQAYRAATGTSFAYSARMDHTPVAQRTIHESVDPKRRNSNGEQVRECLDSPQHPNALPVVVGFDETGSMGHAPRTLQQKLALLKGATLRVGLTDAQLLFAAYGDAHNAETAPVQVGQFESGLEMEDWLNNLFLEGNGGGNGGETSGLLLYFLAHHSRLDSLTKRGKKGYLILTGDEVPHRTITRAEIKRYLGYDVEADLTIEQVIAEVKKQYEVFFFLVDNSTAHYQDSLKVWGQLLGTHYVIPVEDLDNISEQIALLLARYEGLVDTLDEGMRMLLAEGADAASVRAAGQALAHFEPKSNVVTAQVTGSLPAVSRRRPGVLRLDDLDRPDIRDDHDRTDH